MVKFGKQERVSTEQITRERGYIYYLGKSGFVERKPTKSNKSGKAGKVGKEKIEREPGFLYFVDSEGYVARTPMARRSN